MATFKVHCPNCRRRHEFDKSVSGRQRKCIQCGTTFAAFDSAEEVVGPIHTGFQKGANRFKEAEAAVAPKVEAEEPRKSPMPFVIGMAALVVASGIGYLVFGRGGSQGAPTDETGEKTGGTTTVSATQEDRYAEEAKAAIAEVERVGLVIKETSQYALALPGYEKLLSVEKRLETLARIREGSAVFSDPKLAEVHRNVVERRKALEAGLLAFAEKQIPTANTLAELLTGYARETLPELRDRIYAATLRLKPDLVHRESIHTLRAHAQRGTCDTLSDPERQAWLFIMRRGDPIVAELFEKHHEEALKLCVGAVTKDADDLLPALLVEAASKPLAKVLYASPIFRNGGKAKVRGPTGETTVEMPKLYAAIPKVAAKAGKLELAEHVEIVQMVYLRGGPETWGEKFMDLMAINGDDPAYRAKLALQLILQCEPRGETALPAADLLKPYVAHVSEDDLKQLMNRLLTLPLPTLTQEKLADMIEKSPSPAAAAALVEAANAQDGPIRVRAAKLSARCRAKGGDPSGAAQALVGWAQEPLDGWKSVFDEYLKQGHGDVVAAAARMLVETGSGKQFDAYLKLAGDVVQAEPKNGAWIASALLKSYDRVPGASAQRKALIVKCKTDEALPEAIALYAKAAAQGQGNARLGNEFQEVLKALLDKRGVRFLMWTAMEKHEREMWAMNELRRVSGQTGGPDADLWHKWYKANESKLPKQIVTAEMGP